MEDFVESPFVNVRSELIGSGSPICLPRASRSPIGSPNQLFLTGQTRAPGSHQRESLRMGVPSNTGGKQFAILQTGSEPQVESPPKCRKQPLLKERAAQQLDGINLFSLTLLVARRRGPSTSRIAFSKVAKSGKVTRPSPIAHCLAHQAQSHASVRIHARHICECARPHHLLLARSTEQCREMSASKPDLSDLWIQHQRKNTKTTQSWACILCPNRRVFGTEPDLWEHAKRDHLEELEARTGDLNAFREEYATESAQKRLVAHTPGQILAPTALLGNFSDILSQGSENQLTPPADQRRTNRSLASRR